MPLLEVQELSLRFGGLTAVKDVTFSLFRGEIVSVIGPNGAGKTSLFNAITGVYEPTEGGILVDQLPSQEQFTFATALRLLLVASMSALGALCAYHCQELWEYVISANYRYQQPFDWMALFPNIIRYFHTHEPKVVLWPTVIGGALGGAGFAQIWMRGRRSPEVVTRFGITRTFQNIRLFPSMSVVENVLLAMDRKLSSSFLAGMLRLPSVRQEEQQALLCWP
jgi:branched-chain amino acid transport system ATP-binding protein